MKKCDIFLIFAQNIDRGYTLEPPQWGGFSRVPTIYVLKQKKKKKKKNIYLCKPQFSYTDMFSWWILLWN